MNRRSFVAGSLTALAGTTKHSGEGSKAQGPEMRLRNIRNPLAITMWDFSWLERRWPGAGYEDWDEALDGLKSRGYDALRIDAYPHLVHYGAERTWELLPVWSVQDWGAPARCGV